MIRFRGGGRVHGVRRLFALHCVAAVDVLLVIAAIRISSCDDFAGSSTGRLDGLFVLLRLLRRVVHRSAGSQELYFKGFQDLLVTVKWEIAALLMETWALFG